MWSETFVVKPAAPNRSSTLLSMPQVIAYHRGLWHMYRFNDKDAQLLFQSAIRLDLTFARAYAGLSTGRPNAHAHIDFDSMPGTGGR